MHLVTFGVTPSGRGSSAYADCPCWDKLRGSAQCFFFFFFFFFSFFLFFFRRCSNCALFYMAKPKLDYFPASWLVIAFWADQVPLNISLMFPFP